MKGQDIAILAGVGIIGFGLLKSDFFQGLGKVGTGVGDAVEGVGGGIATAGQGLGEGVADLSGQITSITGDVAELTSFVGEFGNWTAQQFEELQQRSLREHDQETQVDEAAFEIIKDPLAETQAGAELFAAEEQAKRDKLKASEATQWTERVTTIDDKAINFIEKSGSFLWKYSPVGLISNYVQSQASVETEAPTSETSTNQTGGSGGTSLITGAVVGGSSVRAPKSSSGSSGVSGDSSSFMEAIGYQGQSTIFGTRWIKTGGSSPTPTATEPVKTSVISKIGGWFGGLF